MPKLVCECCGSTDDSVRERERGFALEIHGVSALEIVCDSCEQKHCDDI